MNAMERCSNPRLLKARASGAMRDATGLGITALAILWVVVQYLCKLIFEILKDG